MLIQGLDSELPGLIEAILPVNRDQTRIQLPKKPRADFHHVSGWKLPQRKPTSGNTPCPDCKPQTPPSVQTSVREGDSHWEAFLLRIQVFSRLSCAASYSMDPIRFLSLSHHIYKMEMHAFTMYYLSLHDVSGFVIDANNNSADLPGILAKIK